MKIAQKVLPSVFDNGWEFFFYNDIDINLDIFL